VTDRLAKVRRPGASRPRRDEPAARLIANAFGLGRLPLAPGTWGSLGALAVLAPLRAASPVAFGLALAALVPLSLWAADRASRVRRQADPGEVVIDEVLGMGLTLAAVAAPSPKSLLAAFLLFRFFDVLKPPPLRRLERLPGGLGIVADDIGAAGWAAAALWLLRL